MLTEEQKANVRKWTAALRSDEFKQGRHVLHNLSNNTYCCLGVACEVFARENSINREEWATTDDLDGPLKAEKFDDNGEYLPKQVQEWLGMVTDYTIDGEDLTQLNDVEKRSFAQIANFIEKKLL